MESPKSFRRGAPAPASSMGRGVRNTPPIVFVEPLVCGTPAPPSGRSLRQLYRASFWGGWGGVLVFLELSCFQNSWQPKRGSSDPEPTPREGVSQTGGIHSRGTPSSPFLLLHFTGRGTAVHLGPLPLPLPAPDSDPGPPAETEDDSDAAPAAVRWALRLWSWDSRGPTEGSPRNPDRHPLPQMPSDFLQGFPSCLGGIL